MLHRIPKYKQRRLSVEYKSGTLMRNRQETYLNNTPTNAYIYIYIYIYIKGGAKRTLVFQIIVTLFVFNIKKLCQHQNNL